MARLVTTGLGLVFLHFGASHASAHTFGRHRHEQYYSYSSASAAALCDNCSPSSAAGITASRTSSNAPRRPDWVLSDEEPFLDPKKGRAALHVDVPWDADVKVEYTKADGRRVSQWTLSRGKYRNFLLERLPLGNDNLQTVKVSVLRRAPDGTSPSPPESKALFILPGDRRYLQFGDKPESVKPSNDFVAIAALPAPAATAPAPAKAAPTGPSVEFNKTTLTANVTYKGDSVEKTTDQGKDVWSGLTFPDNPTLILYHNHAKPPAFTPKTQTAQLTIRMFLATQANRNQLDQQKEVPQKQTWDIEFGQYNGANGQCNLSAAGVDVLGFVRTQLGGTLSAKDKIAAVRIDGYIQFVKVIVNAENGQQLRVTGETLQTAQPLWINLSPPPK